MEIFAKSEADVLVLSVLENRIDAAASLSFKEQVRAKAEAECALVILDLSRVTFIDSSGLGAIVASMKNLAPQQKLILAGLTPSVEKVFKLTRMDQVFDLFLTVEAALGAQRVNSN
ncbi:MAG: STAS domain-containing protein [Pseudomonadota bacterium]